MKITKRQLKRIIKEEKRKLLREYRSPLEETLWNALDVYVMTMDEELGYDTPQEELKANVIEFVNDYFKDSAYAAQQAQEDEDYDPDSFIDPRRQ